MTEVEFGRDYSKWFLLVWTLGFIFLLICIIASSFLRITNPEAFDILIGYSLGYMVMLICAMFLFRLRTTSDNPEATLIGLGLGLLSLFGLSAVFTAIGQALNIIDTTATLGMVTFSTVAGGEGLSLINGIPVAIVFTLFMNIPAPIAEECAFRVFFWRLLTPALGVNKAIIAQAGLFGIVHYFVYGFNYLTMLLAFCAGLALGIIYVKVLGGKNELAIIGAHLIYNMVMLFK